MAETVRLGSRKPTLLGLPLFPKFPGFLYVFAMQYIPPHLAASAHGPFSGNDYA
jgi:hypothetical protein